jgi:phosphopantothenoylcysteine decarboxylase/phosphopantothenate--cysteine ligase
MACGEEGSGRMAEPHEILAAAERLLKPASRPLTGLRALVTSGPTHEAIDPVRYVANRSSGRQGHAVAAALAEAGAEVTLVTGPVALPDPPGVRVRPVVSAREMLAAVEAGLPADVAVFAAAVADWRPAVAPDRKMKKVPGEPPPALEMVENPDILRSVARRRAGEGRPRLVVGFAAETGGDLEAKAAAKLERKGCDWILANDVSPGTESSAATATVSSCSAATAPARTGPSSTRPSSAAGWRHGSPPPSAAARPGPAMTEAAPVRSRSRSSACRTRPACRCRPTQPPAPPASTCWRPCRRASRWSCRRAAAARWCRPG